MIDLLVYAILGAGVRALFGIYKAYQQHEFVQLDYQRLAIEVVSAVFFGLFTVSLLLDLGFLSQKIGPKTVSLIAGLFGADLMNVLAKRVGVSKGFSFAVQRLPAYKGLNVRQRRALEYALSGGISNDEYQRLNRVTNAVAQRDLTSLAKKGFLRKTGSGRGTRYV